MQKQWKVDNFITQVGFSFSFQNSYYHFFFFIIENPSPVLDKPYTVVKIFKITIVFHSKDYILVHIEFPYKQMLRTVALQMIDGKKCL